MKPSFLAQFNHFFYRRSLSLFDWMAMLLICNLGQDNAWYFLLLIPVMPLSDHLKQRFTLD